MNTLIQWVSNYNNLPVILALVGSGISVYTDFRWRKIKNFITFPLIIFGYIWSFLSGGILGLLINLPVSWLIGVLACRGAKMGAGDIKLLVGIAACLQPQQGFAFLAFYYLTMMIGAIFVRLKRYCFKLKPALSAMWIEATMEMGGEKNANKIVHGQKIEHIGAPIIFIALVFLIIKFNC